MQTQADLAPPPHAEHAVFRDRAVKALEGNRPQEALDLLRDIPENPHNTILLARAWFLLGNYERSAEALSAVSEPFGPHPAIAFFDQAAALGRRADLLKLLKACVARNPADYRLPELQGTILMQLGYFTEAERYIRDSISRQPEANSPRNTLSMVLYEQGKFDEALVVLEDIRKASPENWGPLCNLACILSSIGRMDEANNLYRQAIAIAPNEPSLRLNHSIAMLKSGRLAQGWTEHEWRLSLPGHTSLPYGDLLPTISPNLDLRGKRVLVTQEEGLGDTLMYLRYLPALARTGASITVWGASTLAAITRRIEGTHSVQTGGEQPQYDYHCPFISLPRAFSGTPDAMGAPVPYITPDPIKAENWKKILHRDRNLRVGLVWAGGARPENTAAYMVDRHRSLPLSALSPLADLDGISFYSLQKDAASSQIADFPGKLIDFMPQCLDMDDTAALIANLDIVVSVDTSIVHLGGGMGKKVLMMDRYNNCWRWMHDRTDSPWYPTLEIIRQTRFGDWTDVVLRVRKALQNALMSRQ